MQTALHKLLHVGVRPDRYLILTVRLSQRSNLSKVNVPESCIEQMKA